MKDTNCGYCMRGELLDKFGIYICDLQVSSLKSAPLRSLSAWVKSPTIELIWLSVPRITLTP